MSARAITVVGQVYSGNRTDGDFAWMVEQTSYDDALFVIAENFLDSLRDDAGLGGGTAVLRYLCPQRVAPGITPRAVGVPTGWSVAAMGFPHMDLYVKTAIDLSLDRIAVVLHQNPQLKRLIYSCDTKQPELVGVKIFETTLSLDVRVYISRAIHDIGIWKPKRTSLESIRKQELKLLPFSLLVTESNSARTRPFHQVDVALKGGSASRSNRAVAVDRPSHHKRQLAANAALYRMQAPAGSDERKALCRQPSAPKVTVTAQMSDPRSRGCLSGEQESVNLSFDTSTHPAAVSTMGASPDLLSQPHCPALGIDACRSMFVDFMEKKLSADTIDGLLCNSGTAPPMAGSKDWTKRQALGIIAASIYPISKHTREEELV